MKRMKIYGAIFLGVKLIEWKLGIFMFCIYELCVLLLNIESIEVMFCRAAKCFESED